MSKIIKFASMQKAPVLIEHYSAVESESLEVINKSIDTTMIDELMSRAQDEIAAMMTDANFAAEKCLDEANRQAESIKENAYAEGYEQGKQQGYQDGLVQGRQTGRDELQSVINQSITNAQQMLMATERDAKEMMKEAERKIIDISLAIARKILAYEIAENPMVVIPLVKAALEKVSDQEEIVIRVSAEDLDAVLLAKRDLQNIVGREHALKIIPDRTIDCGSCVIDTSYGTVDARLDTQFAAIKKTLQDLAQ